MCDAAELVGRAIDLARPSFPTAKCAAGPSGEPAGTAAACVPAESNHAAADPAEKHAAGDGTRRRNRGAKLSARLSK